MADSVDSGLAAPASMNAGASPSAAHRRSAWLKTLHQWHWISSALCLLGMVLFSFTGITLNHAAQIEAKPEVTRLEASLPEPLRRALQERAEDGDAPLPPELRGWIAESWSLDPGEGDAEWSADEIYLAMPRPGGDAWLRIDLSDGAAEYELLLILKFHAASRPSTWPMVGLGVVVPVLLALLFIH